MPWSATHKYARISPRKVRLVTDLIRGRDASEALDILKFTNKRASSFVRKVLQSAIANADEQEADVEQLFVSSARVDEGPTMKRFQPKDRGRAFTILKRTSHIKIEVDVTKT
jgi:large subunit ribosomal protein L22